MRICLVAVANNTEDGVAVLDQGAGKRDPFPESWAGRYPDRV